MTDSTLSKPESLHQWLMSDRPLSRRQAALGRAYGACRTFSRNRLAMLGLFIVLAYPGFVFRYLRKRHG